MSFLRALRKAFLSPSRAFKSYSQCGEDAVMHHLLSVYHGPKVYVDVGCHHPKRGSNTYAFYRLGWRGLLIDLEQEKLLTCRLARPFDRTVCAAISDSEFEASVFCKHPLSPISTINPAFAEKTGLPFFRAIKTSTLQTVLGGFGIPNHFGILSVDVEGEDLAVLKGLDLIFYSPQLICAETLSPATQIEMQLYLTDYGYDLVAKAGPSCIFWRPEKYAS